MNAEYKLCPLLPHIIPRFVLMWVWLATSKIWVEKSTIGFHR